MIGNLLLLPFVIISTNEQSFLNPTTAKESIYNKINQYNTFFVQNNLMHLDSIEVEYIGVIYNEDRKEYNYYVDFANQDGYFLFSKNLQLTAYEFGCDLPDIRNEQNNIIFNHRCFYYNDIQEDKIVTKNIVSPTERNDYPNNRLSSSIVEYNSIATYLYNKYGTTFTLSSYNQLYGFSQFTASSEGYDQGEESVFVKNNGVSEGNCGLVSTSNAISYYSHYRNYNNLPNYSSMTSVDPYANTTILYAAASQYYYPKASIVDLHTIYKKARDYAINVGYVVTGLDDYQTNYVYINTLNYYGYSNSSYIPVSQSNITQAGICSAISSNKPVQLRTSGDAVYGGHGMMITGYRLYSGLFSEGFVSIPVEIFCVSIYDGYSHSERWYDYEQLSMFPYPNNSYRSSSTTIAYYNI